MRRSLSAVTIALVVLAACSDDEPAGSGPTTPGTDGGAEASTDAVFTETSPGVLEAKVRVVAATGATLALPGDARFEIPAGALAADTEITIRVPKDQTRASRFRDFHMEPTGLKFSKPATLRVPYELIDGKEPFIRAWARGDLNKLVSTRSEITDRESMNVLGRNAADKTIDLEVSHFTFFNVLIQVDELLYFVPNIPPKYLLPGDMVFVLTSGEDDGGPNWNPGHVGIFVGGGEVCKTGVTEEVIHSTPASEKAIEDAQKARDDAIKLGKAAPPLPIDGVQTNTLRTFKTDSGHWYLGARRPGDGNPVSGPERQQVTDYVKAQLNKPYNIIGQGNVNEDSWSCVGLAEEAYDKINRGSMGPVREAFAGTPLELYWNTKPVEEITVGVGEMVEFFVAGTIVHPDSLWPGLLDGVSTRGYYCDAVPCGSTNSNYQANIAGQPADAAFTRSGHKYRFAWQPTEADAGATYDMTFTMQAPILGSSIVGNVDHGLRTTEARLKINVVPCPAPVERPGCFVPQDPPETRTACLVGGDDARLAATEAVIEELLVKGTYNNSNPLLPVAIIRPEVDFIDTLTIVFAMTDPALTAAFGNTHFPCGDGVFGRTLCPTPAATQAPGDWILISARLYGETPGNDPKYQYQYGFVFDADGVPSNNYRAKAPFTQDYFDNTDRWYEAVYAPGTGWQMKVRTANASNVVTPVASAARIILGYDTISLAVPKSEFASANPGYRVTAFRHTGDFGQMPPYDYSADAHPKVGDPLKVVP